MNDLIDKKIGNEVEGNVINEIFEGYLFKITGGFDKDGFAMKNGILSQARRRILLQKGSKNFRFKRGYHRDGVRKRKLVRGCIVSADIKVLNLKITKNGPKPIPGNYYHIYSSYLIFHEFAVY
jgi:small subunit ribosomal protein S6e